MKTWFPFVVVLALIGGTMGLTALVGEVKSTTEPGISMSLPVRVGEWFGERQAVSDVERRGLPQDTEFERKRYFNAAGEEIYSSIVMAGKDTRSIHRPEICLPSQGWSIVDSRCEDIPLAAGVPRVLQVRALKIYHPPFAGGGDAGVERLSYYWFVGKDRVTASHLERAAWNIYDRLVHSVNHRWAYLTVSADLPRGGDKGAAREVEEQRRQRVRGFIQILFPMLQQAGTQTSR
ncbi:MAG: EpsI family protein [Verrucomicrobia bacterium]|nr:EpsI family protein [Verrucomicrobiota bacterium]